MRTSIENLPVHDNDLEQVKQILRASYECCAFCNTKLVFTHDLNLSYFQVLETSRCPGCGVTMRPRKFTLH